MNNQSYYEFPQARELSVDPVTLDSVAFDQSPEEFWGNEADPRLDEMALLRKLTQRLSKSDRELYNSYYILGNTQEEIASTLGVSQYAICHSLQTIQRRLQVLAELPKVKWSNIYRLLKVKQGDGGVLELTLKSFLRNHSQLVTSEDLTRNGLPCSQSTVRHRLLTLLRIFEARGKVDAHKHLSTLMSSGKVLHNRRGDFGN